MTQPRELRIHIARLVVHGEEGTTNVPGRARIADLIRDAIGTHLSDARASQPANASNNMPTAVAREVLGHRRLRPHVSKQMGGDVDAAAS